MTPDEWLASFEAKVADVQQKAAAFKENLAAAGATEGSADGSVRVTVAPNGALTGLTIEDAAMRHQSGGELAGEILRLAGQAQRSAASKVTAAFAPLAGAGADTETLRMVTGYARPALDDDDFSNDQIFGRDDDDA